MNFTGDSGTNEEEKYVVITFSFRLPSFDIACVSFFFLSARPVHHVHLFLRYAPICPHLRGLGMVPLCVAQTPMSLLVHARKIIFQLRQLQLPPLLMLMLMARSRRFRVCRSRSRRRMARLCLLTRLLRLVLLLRCVLPPLSCL